MANCQTSIQQAITYTDLESSVTYSRVINSTANAVFRIVNDASQTVTFTINVTAKSTSSVNMFFTIYDTNLNLVRQTQLTNVNNTSQTDLDEGVFYVCVRNILGTYTVDVMADYIRFSRNTVIPADMYTGAVVDFDIKTQKQAVECNQPLFYELIEGALPVGLTMLPSGYIAGQLPIIDTTEKVKIASANLFYNENGVYVPIGHPYTFTLKVSLFNDREVFDIAKFNIAIVNDWSLNDDVYQSATTPTTYISDVIITEREPVVLLCCDNGTAIKGDYLLLDVSGNTVEIDVHESVLLLDSVTTIENRVEVKPAKCEVITVPDANDAYKYIVQNYNTLVDSGYEKAAIDYYLETLNCERIVLDNGVNMVKITYSEGYEYSDLYDSTVKSQLMLYNPQMSTRNGETLDVTITTRSNNQQ